MNKTGISLLEGMERLGLMAARIRQNDGLISRLEIDIILQELRNLYVDAMGCRGHAQSNQQNNKLFHRCKLYLEVIVIRGGKACF